jgi:hypothetical protein
MDDEDADLRANLASLGPCAIADLKRVLDVPQTHRDALLRRDVVLGCACQARPLDTAVEFIRRMSDRGS